MYRLSRMLFIVTVLTTMACILAVAFMIPVFLLVLGVLCAIGLGRKGHSYWTAYGTARWASTDDLKRAGMLGATSGLILGRAGVSRPSWSRGIGALFNPFTASKNAAFLFLTAFGMRKEEPPLVRLPRVVHTAVFAPTGVGKGASLVIPFLLTSPDSVVVIDFKGELARETAEHRRKTFGHRVVILDPFKVTTQTSDSFNPIDWVDKTNPDCIDQCRSIANAIVVRTGHEHEMHWNDAAEIWISSMAAVVAMYGEPGDRSIQTMRRLLTDPKMMEGAVKLLCASTEWGGLLARLGHQLGHYQGKELASILTTVNRHMRFFDTPPVVENTRTSSFDPSELRNGKMTVYLILPPDVMRAQSGLLRLWIDSMMRAIVRGGLEQQNKVHFVLDEAASLGHLDSIDDAVDKYRGYGIRLQFYYQSLGQLKKCFPDGQDQTLLSNCTQVFFGINDYQSAEYVSSRLGEKTIVVSSGGTSTGTTRQVSDEGGKGSSSSSTTESDNWSQLARKLLQPSEVLALNERTAITFTPGIPPLWTTLIRYYEESLNPSESFWGKARKAVWTLGASLLLVAAASLMVAVVDMASRKFFKGGTQCSVNYSRQWPRE